MFNNLEEIGNVKSDSPQIIIQKAFLVYLALFMGMGGLLWGSISLYFDLRTPSLIPYGYTVLTAFNLIYFSVVKDFNLAKFIQVLLSLVLPFLFQWSLGGYLSSGVIMLWAVLAVISSLTFYNLTNSLIWLYLYIALCMISGFYETYFQSIKPDILPDSSILFIVLNTTIISAIVFGLMAYFTKSSEAARIALEQNQNIIKENSRKIEILLSQKSEANKEMTLKNQELNQVMKELESKEIALLEITKKQTTLYDRLLKDDLLGGKKDI